MSFSSFHSTIRCCLPRLCPLQWSPRRRLHHPPPPWPLPRGEWRSCHRSSAVASRVETSILMGGGWRGGQGKARYTIPVNIKKRHVRLPRPEVLAVHFFQDTGGHVGEPEVAAEETSQVMSVPTNELRDSLPTHPWKTRLTLSLRLLVHGESTGVCLVKLTSNCDTSSSPESAGSKGGRNLRSITSDQDRCLRRATSLVTGKLRTRQAPLIPLPPLSYLK